MRNKRLLVLVFILVAAVNFNLNCAAQNSSNDGDNLKEITFIYLNGANNNTPKMKHWFYEGIGKFHPVIRNQIIKSDFMQKYFLENSTYTIAYSPQIFFWGDKSSHEIRTLYEDLMFTKSSSPKLAQIVRTVFTACMHDAIWVQKDHNMHGIIEELHKMVLENHKQNRPVVLFGYSAGSFITYEYLFNKLPNIDTKELFERIKLQPKLMEFVRKNDVNDTCIDALINSNLAVFSSVGNLVAIENEEDFKKNYNKLDDYTCQYCMPKGSIKGVINYASPLPLFYSDITNPNYIVTHYVRLMYKYIVDNNMFWLTVNYADDPLGYPTTRNMTPSEYEEALNILLNKEHYGFIYDKSNVKSPRTFIGAHTSYWNTSKKFAKAVVDGYEEGYTYFNIYDKQNEEL